MISLADYDKLKQIMGESPEKKELLSRLIASHQMEISSISHELRNPLTLVYSTLQLIESQHPEAKGFRYWSDLRNDIEYMKDLLETLSTYNNGDRLYLSSIDSSSFFRTAAISFASSLIETDIQFVSHIEPNLPKISGDVMKLKEVLLNLFANAKDAVLSASIPNGAIPTISFTVSQIDTAVHIEVKDNGCGISKEQLPHIFEPFVTTKQTGTGLGLPIVSRILAAHKGSIQVSSVQNVHTTFHITLPIQKNRKDKSCN